MAGPRFQSVALRPGELTRQAAAPPCPPGAPGSAEAPAPALGRSSPGHPPPGAPCHHRLTSTSTHGGSRAARGLWGHAGAQFVLE